MGEHFARAAAVRADRGRGSLGLGPAPDFGLVTAQADVDAMMEKMMGKIKSRPRPSLAMQPKRPFASGCSPEMGFQALAITVLGPGENGSGKRKDGAPDLLPNPAFESPAWYTAPKLMVTAWGRACECARACTHTRVRARAVLAAAGTACP